MFGTLWVARTVRVHDTGVKRFHHGVKHAMHARRGRVVACCARAATKAAWLR